MENELLSGGLFTNEDWDEGGGYTSESVERAISKTRQAVAKEIEEMVGEDLFEPILNFYILDSENKQHALDVWQQFKQALKSRYLEDEHGK